VTESVHKKVIIGFIVLFALLGFYTYGQQNNLSVPAPDIQDLKPVSYPDKIIGRIGEGYFNFEVADTQEEKTKGLSGRDQLPDTDAMLFTFVAEGRNCFWMKDMKFAIDMLWFNADKKLVYEKRNATPESYPESFCPDVPAKYVVEVTSGVAEKNQIKLGDYLQIEP
jgi:uncharacterized membrane protein (UPF0127 family)